MEKTSLPRTTINLEKATQLARLNTYSIQPGTKNRSVCVDPRYGYIQCRIQERPMAKPGADLGDLMNAFHAMYELGIPLDDIAREKIWESVIKTVDGEDNFSFHTDHHAEDAAAVLPGCGHLLKAAAEPQAYGIQANDIEFINKKIKTLNSNRPADKKADKLEGEHEEQAVFVVKGDKLSISPILTDESGAKIQAFHYNADLVTERIQILAKNLLSFVQRSKPDISLEELTKVLQEAEKMQLKATLQRLAKGLNVFEIWGDSPANMQIKQAGVVE